MFTKTKPSLIALEKAPVYFTYGKRRKVLIDALTAGAVLACYRKLKSPEHRVKFQLMVESANESVFYKLVDFCWKHVTIG